MSQYDSRFPKGVLMIYQFWLTVAQFVKIARLCREFFSRVGWGYDRRAAGQAE